MIMNLKYHDYKVSWHYSIMTMNGAHANKVSSNTRVHVRLPARNWYPCSSIYQNYYCIYQQNSSQIWKHLEIKKRHWLTHRPVHISDEWILQYDSAGVKVYNHIRFAKLCKWIYMRSSSSLSLFIQSICRFPSKIESHNNIYVVAFFCSLQLNNLFHSDVCFLIKWGIQVKNFATFD